MSLRVLIIPEDHRVDQYFLAPIITSLLSELGKPNAKVQVCQEIIGGVSEVLKRERLVEILDIYGMADLYLVCVDRDCVDGRRASLDRLEEYAATKLRNRQKLVAECAWEELEVWLLAGLDLPPDWLWQDVRNECHPKERYFQNYSISEGLELFPAEGRGVLGEKASRRINAIRQKCREFDLFANRILESLQ